MPARSIWVKKLSGMMWPSSRSVFTPRFFSSVVCRAVSAAE
jgi:hypothetical protein